MTEQFRHPHQEDELLRSVALQNTQAILLARQRVEQQLREAKRELEARSAELAQTVAALRATLDATTDGILVTDDATAITGYNQRYLTMWQVAESALQRRDRRELIALTRGQLKDPEAFESRIREIETEAPEETYDVLEFADGRIYERFSRIQYVDGTKHGRVWSFRDVTERRRTEHALVEETRMLELLNRSGTTLAAKLDLHALLQTVTDAATELSGARFGAFFYNVTSAEGDVLMLYTLSGAPREAFDKFGNPRATALFGPTFRGEGTIRSDDILQDERYGTMAPHHGMPKGHLPVRSYLAVPVRSRNGEVIGGLFFGHPDRGVFTERVEHLIEGVAAQAGIAVDNARLYEAAQTSAAERQRLLESERAARTHAERMGAIKDEFLATLSHELRTPLSAILGWSQVLRVAMSPDELEQGLQTIERNARIQIQLIKDLLDMSRIATGKLRLDVQPLEPITFIEAAIGTVRPAVEAKGLRLEQFLDPSAGPVSGDPSRLQQVIWNLLSNAIKFTPKGGKIQVRLERVNSHIEVSVADTGIGIKTAFLPHVFERFRQADASTTREYGGLGLGLSIVRHLVELHGGTVHVSSAGESQGTTFTVHLPLTIVHDRIYARDRVHPRSSRLAVSDVTLADLAGVKVLVVDDEPDARDLIQRVLRECSAEVYVADGAAAALRLLAEHRPDVLISDIGMPDVDGYEFLKRVRALGAANGGALPAIALTAFARSEDRTRALRAGFLVHVAKPVEPSELVATVATVVGRAGEVSAD